MTTRRNNSFQRLSDTLYNVYYIMYTSNLRVCKHILTISNRHVIYTYLRAALRFSGRFVSRAKRNILATSFKILHYYVDMTKQP